MPMPTLSLNDGRRIPQLGFGVWQITGAKAVPVVSAALDVGYRHIDTAAAYGNEHAVGQAIAASGIAREELFVTTKLGDSRHGDAYPALQESLDRLGLDYIDLYLIHWPLPRVNQRVQAWQDMERAQADGLVRSIGVSNFTPRYLQQILDHGTVVPAVNQIEYHPTYQQPELHAFGARHQILTEAWSPLGMGTAVGNPAIAAIADRVGATPAQVIIAWHLQAGRIVIPKSSTPSRIAENHAAAAVQLDAADITTIDHLNTGHLLGWDPEDV